MFYEGIPLEPAERLNSHQTKLKGVQHHGPGMFSTGLIMKRAKGRLDPYFWALRGSFKGSGADNSGATINNSATLQVEINNNQVIYLRDYQNLKD